jgi:hypothetical protein
MASIQMGMCNTKNVMLLEVGCCQRLEWDFVCHAFLKLFRLSADKASSYLTSSILTWKNIRESRLERMIWGLPTLKKHLYAHCTFSRGFQLCDLSRSSDKNAAGVRWARHKRARIPIATTQLIKTTTRMSFFDINRGRTVIWSHWHSGWCVTSP